MRLLRLSEAKAFEIELLATIPTYFLLDSMHGSQSIAIVCSFSSPWLISGELSPPLGHPIKSECDSVMLPSEMFFLKVSFFFDEHCFLLNYSIVITTFSLAHSI